MKTIILISTILISSATGFTQNRGNRGGNSFNYIQTNGFNGTNKVNEQSINQSARNVQNLNFDNVNNISFDNVGFNQSRGNRGGHSTPNRGNRGNIAIQVNTDRNQAQQIVNDNSFIQSVQVIEIQSRGNRGNVASRGSNANVTNRGSRGNSNPVASIPTQQKANQVKTENVKAKPTLKKIELPKPKSVEISTKESISSPKVPLTIPGLAKSEKKKKASQGWGRNPNNKHFMKKKVWRPMKKWFKRHFKRTKKSKVKLTCFFKS